MATFEFEKKTAIGIFQVARATDSSDKATLSLHEWQIFGY